MSVVRITKKKSSVRLDADEFIFQLIGSFLDKADDWRSLCLVSKNSSLIRHHKRYFTVKLSENWQFGLENMKGLWLHTQRGGKYECDFDPKEVRDLVKEYFDVKVKMIKHTNGFVRWRCYGKAKNQDNTNFGLDLLLKAVVAVKNEILSQGGVSNSRVAFTELKEYKYMMHNTISYYLLSFMVAVHNCCKWDLYDLDYDKLKAELQIDIFAGPYCLQF